MHRLQAIWFSTFVVLSNALQSQLAKQHTHAAGFQNDWDVMKEAFNTEFTFNGNTCDSNEYSDFFTSLPAFSRSQLEIPPNTKILFYGHSMLHEVLQNILAANEDILIKSGPFGGMEGDRIDMLHSQTIDGLTGFLVKWDFTVNSTIHEVLNYWPLQLEESVANLTKFMQDNHFDIAFFMNPHPNCGFLPCESCSDFCTCWYKEGGFPLKCNADFEGYLRGPRSDKAQLWNVIHKAMGGKVYEVEGWTTEQRTSFHADDEHTIRTYPILAGHACNTDDNCTNRNAIMGHQCQPGRISLVSELAMAKTKHDLLGIPDNFARLEKQYLER